MLRWFRFSPVAALIAVGVLTAPAVHPVLADVPLYLESPIVKALIKGDWVELKRLLVSGGDVNTRDAGGQPVVALAARDGLTPGLELLIAHNVRIDAPDAFGNTALMWAAARDRLEAMEILIDNGANVDARNNQGVTALMRAAEQDNAAAAAVLLERGASPDITDYTGRDALAWAEDSGARKTAREVRRALR